MTTPDVEQNPVVARLLEWDRDAASQVLEFRGETTLVVPAARMARVAEYLKVESGYEFNFLSDISVVDRFPVEPRFELNYHLLSISRRQPLRLRVRIPGGAAPTADTVTNVWPTANWHEREIFDLFGIQFHGHPDMRRILMPDDWEGFPLRRDYPTEGYR